MKGGDQRNAIMRHAKLKLLLTRCIERLNVMRKSWLLGTAQLLASYSVGVLQSHGSFSHTTGRSRYTRQKSQLQSLLSFWGRVVWQALTALISLGFSINQVRAIYKRTVSGTWERILLISISHLIFQGRPHAPLLKVYPQGLFVSTSVFKLLRWSCTESKL